MYSIACTLYVFNKGNVLVEGGREGGGREEKKDVIYKAAVWDDGREQ